MTRIARLLGLLALLAGPAAAEVARVSGGEHADFTRLVVEAADADGWLLGRASDGYELRMPDSVTSFDVTQAFEKIPRDRLAALWQDPQTGALRFSLSCACHAIAFEFRPGIVVIDIRTGPAPEGSSFEAPLPAAAGAPEPAEAAAEAAPAPAAAEDSGYDWIALQREGAASAPELPLPMPLPTGEVSLDPLRDALLSQISKGAAEGVVEIAEGGVRPEDDAANPDDGPWSRVAVGELPGLATGDDRGEASALTPDGRACLPDGRLDVASWGNTSPAAVQIGLARSGLLTEFDAPVEDAILRAARFHVFMGFGAEARQILGFLTGADPQDAPLLRAMAHVIDEEPPSENPFLGMETCDSAAALWAVLAADRQGGLPPLTNADAVARSFSALPPHLRKYLGGRLVDLFLAAGDQETARKLRDAALRTPAPEDPDLALMDAKYQLAQGDTKEAGALAEGVMDERGPATAKAAITLVEAAFQGERVIDPTLPSALEVFLRDAGDGEERAALLRATLLAHAMAGDFAAALSAEGADAATFSDLWSLAVEGAEDGPFLEEAARQATNRPETRPDVELAVAQRLMTLGLADLALGWLGPVGPEQPEERRLLAGQAHLAVRDALAARAAVEGLSGPEADKIRAAADLQLGDARAAAEGLVRAGEAELGQRTAVWTQDWSFVGETGPEDWKQAIDALDQPAADAADTAPKGPIARGTDLVEESAKAREAIEGLLTGLTPAPPSQ